MNGNRGQYTSAPLYNMKNKRPAPAAQPGEQPAPSRRFTWLAAVLSLVLPGLFLLSLLIPNDLLRWAFLILTLLAVIAMWLLKAFVKSARGTLTVVYGALAVVIGLALFMSGQSPETRNASSKIADQGALFTNTDAGSLGALLQTQVTPEPVDSPSVSTVSAAQQQLQLFMTYWAEGSKIPQMIQLCVPSWVAQQQSPEQQLFNLIFLRQPTQYQIEAVQGSDADTSRTITLKVNMVQNGSSTVQRMQVLMFRVNDVWYVDPQSLNGTLVDEAAESATQDTPMIATTIAPTSVPSETDQTKLYYNKNNGKYYHAVPNCPDVAQRYWPLDSFYYSDLNSQKFKNLLRCPTCNAPERPAN